VLILPCIAPHLSVLLFRWPGLYEGVVRGPLEGDSTESEMQFVVEWTPINMDGSVKGGEPIEEETEKESEVVKAHKCYTCWCKQQESLKGQHMEVDYSDNEKEEGDVVEEGDDEGHCVEYYTEIDNETPEMVAAKFEVDVADIIDVNKERFKRKLTIKSKFFLNTLLWIPVQMEDGEEDAQVEQDTQRGDGGPEAAAAAAGDPAAAAAEEEEDAQVEQDTQRGDGGPEAAAAAAGNPAAAAAEEEEDAQVEQDTQRGDGGPEAAAAAGEAATDKDEDKNKCEEEQVATAALAKQARSPVVRSFAPPFNTWGFRSKRRGASAAATCGAIDVYLYPPGETKPLMSKIGVIKWIGQNKGKVTSEDERMITAMWAAARGACDSVDMTPFVLGPT